MHKTVYKNKKISLGQRVAFLKENQSILRDCFLLKRDFLSKIPFPISFFNRKKDFS